MSAVPARAGCRLVTGQILGLIYSQTHSHQFLVSTAPRGNHHRLGMYRRKITMHHKAPVMTIIITDGTAIAMAADIVNMLLEADADMRGGAFCLQHRDNVLS